MPHIETPEVITFRVFDAGNKMEFTNNSLNSQKIGKLNIDTKIIPQGLLIHEKTQTKKSHATVPLSVIKIKVKFIAYWIGHNQSLMLTQSFQFYILRTSNRPCFDNTLNA